LLAGGRLAPARLTSRIVLLNIAGLIVLVLGILYFNQFRQGLIDARVQSLMPQANIIAAAVAGTATIDTGSIVIDPDALALCAEALSTALWVGAPIALAAAVSGLVAGLLQGFFALADPAVGQFARGLGVVLAWVVLGPEAVSRVVAFAGRAWGAL
jgi:flagellar biosynthesis protein FliQ